MVKLDNFNEKHLNKEFQYVFKSLTYLAWPTSDAEDSDFWHKLKLTLIKKSSSYTNVSLEDVTLE